MSTSIPHEIKRSSAYWCHDGNIVIQAQNTQFRVHQSLLEKHLPVFADMFTFTRDSENVEGCPVVQLAADRTEDWENMLMTVYSPFMNHSSTMEYPIPVVLSILRVAIKYQADHLRDMAATCLRKNIPNDLQQWCSTATPAKTPPFIDYIFDILDTALDFGMQSIVPTACLFCIYFMGLDKILDGHTRKDDSKSLLSHKTSKMLVRGWHAMTESAIDLTINRPMKHGVTKRCQGQYSVDTSPNDFEIYNCDVEIRTEIHASRTRLVAKNPANAFTLGDIELCKVCADPIDNEFYSAREELWSKLPSFFGCPAWDELKDFDA